MLEFFGFETAFMLTNKENGEDLFQAQIGDSIPEDPHFSVVARADSGWKDARGNTLFFGDFVFPLSGYFSRKPHLVFFESGSALLLKGTKRLWLTSETLSRHFVKVGIETPPPKGRGFFQSTPVRECSQKGADRALICL